MAAVNPDLPNEQAPMTLGLIAKPVSEFAFNKEGAMGSAVGIKGLGSAFKDAVTGADDVVKSVIDQALYQGVDRSREGFTGALETIAGVPPQNRVGDYQADNPYLSTPSGEQAGATGGQGLNLIPGATAAPVPEGLNSGLKAVQSLTGASINGKLSPTYYTGRLDLVGKDLRSQWGPGYRPYIDQEIARITGGNPANEYIKELLTSINQAQGNQKTDFEKGNSFILENSGLPDAKLMMDRWQQGYRNGTMNMSDLVQWASPNKSIEEQAKRDEAQLKSLQADKATKDMVAQSNLNNIGTTYTAHRFITVIGDKRIDFDNLPDFLNKAATGNIPGFKQTDADQLAQSMTAFKTQMAADLYGLAVKNGSVGQLGDPKVKEQINAKLENTVQPVIDALTKGDWSLAHKAATAVKSITDMSAEGLVTNKNDVVRNWSQARAGLSKFGPNAGNILDQRAFSKGFGSAMQTYMSTNVYNIGNGSRTLGNILDEYNDKGLGKQNLDTNPVKKSDTQLQQERRVIQTTTTAPLDVITSSKTTTDEKLASYQGMFGPGNEGIVDKFVNDQFTAQGKLIPGQHAMVSRMTSPAVVASIKKLNDEHPGVWDNYKVWFDKNGSNVIKGDVQSLNKLVDNPDLQVTMDPKTYQFNVVFPKEQSSSPFHQEIVKQSIRNTVGLINATAASMATIAKAEGSDPIEFIKARMPDINPKVFGTEKKTQGEEPSVTKIAEIEPGKTPLEDITNRPMERGGVTLNPQFKEGLETAITDYQEETGKKVDISSLIRTREEQAKAYAMFLGGRGGLAAPPGHSRHEIGQAADFNNDRAFGDWLRSHNPGQYGLEFLPGDYGRADPYHVQLKRGSTRTASK